MNGEIITLTPETEEKILARTVRVLRNGGLVVSPTDTVYGILGNAQNEDAIQKIFALKRRNRRKALGVFVRDIPAARRLAEIDDRKARFLERVWPGAVTVIFYKKAVLPDSLTGSLPTIGIRVPTHPFLLKLLDAVSFSIVQTSANISGETPIQTVSEAWERLGSEGLIDLCIDGGALSSEQSTAVDFTGETPVITRAGAFRAEYIVNAFSQE